MSKQNYKIYPINNVETALEVLGDLICSVILNLNLHLKYHNELKELAIKYFDEASIEDRKNKTIYITAEDYYNIKDKILFRQMMLLIHLADEQKTSFSYIHLRKFLKNKGFLNNTLPEEVNKQLNELLRLRNWTFHNTQSNYTAYNEIAEKEVPSGCSIIKKFNPVIINDYLFIDIKELISYDEHLSNREKCYELILQHMKSDYENMYKSINENNEGYEVIFTPDGCHTVKKGSSVEYIINRIPCAKNFMSISGKTAQLSMAIQNSQYDGSDDKYKEILSFFAESE